MMLDTDGRRRGLGRGLSPGVLFGLAVLSSCSWGASTVPTVNRPYRLEDVHRPPRLLYCSEYRPPPLNEPYTSAVQVEFDVTATGSVINTRVMEGGSQVSSAGSMGDALTKMKRHHLKRLPVVSKGKIVGELTMKSILLQFKKVLRWSTILEEQEKMMLEGKK